MSFKKITFIALVVLGVLAIAVIQLESTVPHDNEHSYASNSASENISAPDEPDSNKSATERMPEDPDKSLEATDYPSPWVNTIDVDPGALYKNYILSATDGDIESAFVLVSAMRECRNVTRSAEEIDQYVSYYPQEVVQHQRRRLKNCESLFKQIDDLDAEYNRWYQEIRSSGHPLFKVKQRALTYEELKPLVKEALSGSYPEPQLYADAFGAASRMYLEYPEHGIDENKFHAWQLMACSAIIGCDHNQMLSELRAQLPEQQVDEIYALEMTYAKSVSSGDTSMFDH